MLVTRILLDNVIYSPLFASKLRPSSLLVRSIWKFLQLCNAKFLCSSVKMRKCKNISWFTHILKFALISVESQLMLCFCLFSNFTYYLLL